VIWELNQYKIAESLKKLIDEKHLSFVTGLGDNIYNCGANSFDDPQFISKFEKLYEKISDSIKFLKKKYILLYD